MTIIKNLIGQTKTIDKQFEYIIAKCIKLNELDIYLHNLNKQAQLYQKSTTALSNPIIKAIEKQNDSIMENLECKILNIISNSNISIDDIMCYSGRIQTTLGNDVDMINMEKNKTVQAYKIYLVADIILNNINKLNQKTL